MLRYREGADFFGKCEMVLRPSYAMLEVMTKIGNHRSTASTTEMKIGESHGRLFQWTIFRLLKLESLVLILNTDLSIQNSVERKS